MLTIDVVLFGNLIQAIDPKLETNPVSAEGAKDARDASESESRKSRINTIQYNSLLTLPWWGFSVTMRLLIKIREVVNNSIKRKECGKQKQYKHTYLRINRIINILTTYYTICIFLS